MEDLDIQEMTGIALHKLAATEEGAWHAGAQKEDQRTTVPTWMRTLGVRSLQLCICGFMSDKPLTCPLVEETTFFMG